MPHRTPEWMRSGGPAAVVIRLDVRLFEEGHKVEVGSRLAKARRRKAGWLSVRWTGAGAMGAPQSAAVNARLQHAQYDADLGFPGVQGRAQPGKWPVNGGLVGGLPDPGVIPYWCLQDCSRVASDILL